MCRAVLSEAEPGAGSGRSAPKMDLVTHYPEEMPVSRAREDPEDIGQADGPRSQAKVREVTGREMFKTDITRTITVRPSVRIARRISIDPGQCPDVVMST